MLERVTNDVKWKTLPPKIQGFLRNGFRRRVSRALGLFLTEQIDGHMVNIPWLGISAMEGRSLITKAVFGYCRFNT
jgi:hypothetical protein